MHNTNITSAPNEVVLLKEALLENTILLISTLSMSIKCLCLWNEIFDTIFAKSQDFFFHFYNLHRKKENIFYDNFLALQ